ncbi:MAG TPA: choice-of-anchor tandem repeat GloVer-containing protein [Chthonomonadales bacterium]|nr:choice-of-anchor tandem repeat GloVer-containing protein [Chthonomonadales bacterium]
MRKMLLLLPSLAAALCLGSVASGQVVPTDLHDFGRIYGNVDGAYPLHGVVEAGDGNFYGVTQNGGRYNIGTLHCVTPVGTFTKIYTLNSFSGGVGMGRLIVGLNGDLYGTTLDSVFRLKLGGQLQVLHRFTGPDGSKLYSGVVQAPDGTLYGTTRDGGTYNNGTVYKIAPDGTFTSLYSFTGGSDGGFIYGGLCLASDGYLYGESWGGGANSTGAIFRISTSGVESVVHSCDPDSGGYNHDGERPQSDLVEGADRRLYGVTYHGGIGGAGTAFVMDLDGGFSLLHAFSGATGSYDGGLPLSGLIQASDGNLYGTTTYGGTHHVGTIFKMTLTGRLTSLYNFTPDQHLMNGPTIGPTELFEGSDGNLYGTTIYGGAGGTGMVYRIPLAP